MQTIISEFETFMRKHGRVYRQFYVGIASDPVDRLTNGHNLDTSIPHIYWNEPLHTESRTLYRKIFFWGKGGGVWGGIRAGESIAPPPLPQKNSGGTMRTKFWQILSPKNSGGTIHSRSKKVRANDIMTSSWLTQCPQKNRPLGRIF